RNYFPSIREYSFGLADPFVSLLGPGALAKAPVRVENPGADTLGQRIPADPLRVAADRNVFGKGREARNQEALVLGPGNRDPSGIGGFPFIRPLAKEPFQPAQVFGIAG